MKTPLTLLTAVGLLAATGCSSTNITKLMEAAGHDAASSTVSVTTIYGSGKYSRIGPGAMGTIAGDGTMTISGTSSNFSWPPELQNALIGQKFVGPTNKVFERIR